MVLTHQRSLTGAVLIAATIGAYPAQAQSLRFDDLSDLPFSNGYLSKEAIAALKDELVFQRAVQSYIWALPALNMYGMKEGSEKSVRQGLQRPADLEGPAQRQDADHHAELRRDLRDWAISI